MPLWKIAWRSIQHRSLASGLTALSMGLGVALVVAVIVVYGVLSQTFMRSAQGYDMIVASAKGSPLEVVLGTVFYSGYLTDTIPYDYFRQLDRGRYSPDVETAIPIVQVSQIQGMPVIATVPTFFTKLKYLETNEYSFQRGENMKAGQDFEAVLGYTAAKKYATTEQKELKVGDTFVIPNAKLVPSEEFPEPNKFKVVGILNPTGTPNDRAFFVNLEGFYIMDRHIHKSAVDRVSSRASTDRGVGEDLDETGTDTGEEEKEKTTDTRRVSAVLVLTRNKEIKPTIRQDASGMDVVEFEGALVRPDTNPMIMSLGQRLVADLDVQVAQPTYEITRLFEMIVGRIQTVLIIFAVLVIIVAGIGMMVSIYNSMNERRQEIAIMRALGARRRTVMAIILLESILLSLGGGVIGLLIGHGLIAGVGPIIANAVMVIVNPWQFQAAELILVPGLILLASIVGYLPAVVAYRTDVAQSLNP